MRNKIILTMVFAGILLLLAPGVVTGESPWPMIRHDAQHTGRSPYPGPERPALKWKMSGIQQSWMALDGDGTLYVESENRSLQDSIIAVNCDGTLKWESGITVKSDGGLSVASDGTIYVTDTEFMAAINNKGKIKWQRKMVPLEENSSLHCIISSPVVTEDTVYVVVGVGGFEKNSKDNKKANYGKLYAFSLDGDVKWQFPTSLPFQIHNPAPAVGKDGTIFLAFTEKEIGPVLEALTPNGKSKWRYEISGQKFIDWLVEQTIDALKRSTDNIRSVVGRAPSLDQAFLKQVRESFEPMIESEAPPFRYRNNVSPLALGDDGMIYFIVKGIGPGDFLCAVDPSGSIRWKIWRAQDVSLSSCSVPAIGPDNTLYLYSSVEGFDRVHSFDSNGEFRWSYDPKERIDTPLSIDGKGIIYFANSKGVVHALNPDGTIKWRYHTGQPPEASLRKGSIAIGRERVLYFAGIFGNGDDLLYAIGEAE